MAAFTSFPALIPAACSPVPLVFKPLWCFQVWLCGPATPLWGAEFWATSSDQAVVIQGRISYVDFPKVICLLIGRKPEAYSRNSAWFQCQPSAWTIKPIFFPSYPSMNVMRGVTLLPLLFDQDVLENHTDVKFLRQDMCLTRWIMAGLQWQRCYQMVGYSEPQEASQDNQR